MFLLVIDALIWAYPKGICTKDPFSGSLPLHLACRHSAPPELVKCVVMAYPTASRIEDMVGRLPLHMACLSGASRLTFIYLLKAFPHAVILKDDRRVRTIAAGSLFACFYVCMSHSILFLHYR